MATGGDVTEPGTCSVCLDPYRNPKFLQCHHTFCAECIADVANSHNGESFPCPSCRKPTSLPAGGVAALQANFYVKKQQATTAPLKRTLCKIHDDKKLEFYCVKCDEAICLNCKLTKHEQHTTDDLTTAAEQKKVGLATDVARLQNAVDKVMKQVEKTREEQKAVLEKKATVEQNIRNRHAILVAAADKFRDEALESIRSVSTDIESDVAKVLKQQEDNLTQLLNIQQQLEETVSGGPASDVIVATKQVKSGRGSEQAVKKLTSTELSVIRRPVVDFNVTSDVMLQKARDFLGTVSKAEMEDAAPEVKVERRFQCGSDADVEVFSLCHQDDDKRGLWVSYERQGLTGDCPETLFNEDGSKLVGSKKQDKVSNKRYAKGKIMSPKQTTDCINTYCKSLSTKHLRLFNCLSGKADVDITNVLSTEPFKAESKAQFTINIGAHRAFDVDATEQHFVVVEEAKPPNMWRKVKLCQTLGRNPVSTYNNPTHRFQPSDVCFYTLGGQHVLLVTDELNDAIHVVGVEWRRKTFLRYLAPGCPLLIQPTAITVDVDGRLWLACRGGDILKITATQ
ncbi:tripartite motif-containing protein 54-like [Littorina saxatilis]|uniref:tripartite motif-containing protein 54-like n=1 Tax=Littorina saxatilis TaxID=31220 RepID=UPI0038B5920E